MTTTADLREMRAVVAGVSELTVRLSARSIPMW